MRITRTMLWLACSSLLACADEPDPQGEQRGLAAASDDAFASGDDAAALGADLQVEDLGCVQGGSVGEILVEFDCHEITTVSCKDLSNVVIERSDGSRTRFEGLQGQRGVFRSAGAPITTVWVKAGANHSGDGPGYGERFDAPAQTCDETPPVAPPPSEEECFIVDGVCLPVAPPPSEEDCFIADGVCLPSPPPPPVLPVEEPGMAI